MKKILWTVNGVMPKLAKEIGGSVNAGGSWLNEPLEILSKNENFEFHVVTAWHRSEYVEKVIDGVHYYILPATYIDECHKPVGKYKKYCQKLVNEIDPDLLHIFGSEFAFGLGFLPYVKCESILTIQGLISVINKRYYYGGVKVPSFLGCLMPWYFLTYFPMKIRYYKNKFRENSEIKQLKRVGGIVGNTSWDYAHTRLVNGKSDYYYVDYAIRHEFFNKQWKVDNVKKHTLFFVNMSVPLKGFHKLLEAADILRKKYPDIKIRVAGPNTIADKHITGYARYLKNKVKKMGLSDVIEFMGTLNGEQMAQEMSQTHTFVLSSAIENGPNVLLEAMLVGMPCVSSFVGGAMDYAKGEEEALFYRFDEPEMLAHQVDRIWSNDELAQKLSSNASQRARKRQNFKEVSEELQKIYLNLTSK